MTNRLFRSTWFPLVPQLLALGVFVLLITERLPESGLRAAPIYLIPGLYGGMFIFMLVAWRLG